MKQLFQVLIFLLGLLGGLYVGGYLMFFIGIVSVIEAIKATPLEAGLLAVGIIKVLFASVVGWGIFWLGMLLPALFD